MSSSLSIMMLLGGLAYLLVGGDFLVRGALALSRRLSVRPMLVGLTVVAAGTSAPELIVSLQAALDGYAGVAIGNVVGSNIANVLLVVGIPALIHPIVSTDRRMTRQVMFMLLVSVLFVAMCFAGRIGQLDGGLLLGVMLIGAILTIRGRLAMPGIQRNEAREQFEQVIGLPKGPFGICLLIVLGCSFLPLGAKLAVDGAVQVAALLGVSDAAVGSTLVALGTSLPELSSTLIAAFRRNTDMALGSVIGSNVLNILAIMGITASIVDVQVPETYLQRDVWFMLGSAALLAFFVVCARPVGRFTGLAFLIGYGGYFSLTL
jgi:cation:H+ antiporter